MQLPSLIDAEALEDIHPQLTRRIGDAQLVVTLHRESGDDASGESLWFVLDCAVTDATSTDLEAGLDKVHRAVEDSFEALIAQPYMRYLKGEVL